MILQALKEYYDRKAANPDSGIAPLGYEWKEIPFLLVIDDKGNFKRIEDTRDGKKAKPFLVPTLGESKGNGIKSNFPWENAEYLFGIPLKQDKNNAVPKRKAQFMTRLREYESEDWAKAIMAFLKDVKISDIKSAYPQEWTQIMKGAYLLFSIEGVPVSDLAAFKRCYHLPTGERCVCLATGKYDFLKEKEPAIKGAGFFKVSPKDNIKSELHVVSFNKDSFTSFGKEQGWNSPIGQITSFAYTNALNHLLAFNSKQKMQVGDATVVFWASREAALENDFADIFDEPDDPDRNTQAVERLLSSVRTGAYLPEESKAKFYVLGLSPNGARISVRFWHTGTIPEMSERFADWFENLQIVHFDKQKEHLSLKALLRSLAPQGDLEKLPPNLAGDVMRSILEGTPYPATLLSSALRRIKAEHDVTYERAKLIKAFLVRNKERKITMSLDKTNSSVGYRLGRLFAVLENIQCEAAKPAKLNATIRDKFYASASATPVAVFGNLVRLAGHHLSKLDSDRKGLRIWLEKQLEEIIAGVATFPAHLPIEEQGMFAIGYYHQRMARKSEASAETATSESSN